MITSSIRFTIAGQISMSILSFCSSRNWSQQKPDLFRLCDYSRWSCMHGLQVNLVSGMAQANDTKGGQMNPLLEGRQSFYLVHFLICQKRPIQNETQGLCIAGCLLLGMISLYVDTQEMVFSLLGVSVSNCIMAVVYNLSVPLSQWYTLLEENKMTLI